MCFTTGGEVEVKTGGTEEERKNHFGSNFRFGMNEETKNKNILPINKKTISSLKVEKCASGLLLLKEILAHLLKYSQVIRTQWLACAFLAI